MATDASWKTMSKLVSSLHFILNPPFTLSHSEKADWISFVLSSFENPVKYRIRVTEADNPASVFVDAISIYGEGCCGMNGVQMRSFAKFGS